MCTGLLLHFGSYNGRVVSVTHSMHLLREEVWGKGQGFLQLELVHAYNSIIEEIVLLGPCLTSSV